MGVVEDTPFSPYSGVHISSISVFLVRDAACIRRNGGDLGSAIFNFCAFILDFSAANMAFFG